MNERLRTVMLRKGVTVDELAAQCGVDPKTVSRWIGGRVPHRQFRWKTAKLLDTDEVYLWPSLVERDREQHRQATQSELVAVYPDRASVERDTWLRLLGEARNRIDVLIFSGTFFAQTNPRVATMLADRAAAGVSVRLCFGDPDAPAVDIRDREEGLRGTLASKIRASLTYYRPLLGVEGCEVRLHGTTLYASLFRYDDEMIVNPHVWGQSASANPVMHLKRLDGAGGWFDLYTRSFDAVWETAAPWNLREEAA